MSKLKELGFINIMFTLIMVTFFIPPLILNPIFLGLLLVTVIFRFFLKKESFHRKNFNKISFFFIVYFSVLLISLLYSEDLKRGIEILASSMSFLIVPLIPLFISKEEVNLEFVAKKYIHCLCFVFFVLFFIAIYKNVKEGYTLSYIFDILKTTDVENGKYEYFNYWYFVYDKFTEPLNIQPIYLGLFTNVGLLFLFFFKKRMKVKSFLFQLTVLSLLILLIASRWQILIFFLNCFLFVVFFEDSKAIVKIGVLISFTTIILIVSIANPVTRTRIKEAFTYKEAFYKDNFGGISIRLKKWDSAIKCISESPLIGFGVGDGKNELLNQYRKDKFYLGLYNKYNSHNQYIDTLLQVGFLGLIPLLLIFFYAYKYSLNKMFLLLLTNTFAIGFITESMLNRQWGVISFSFLLIVFSIFDFKKV
ncbi:MAG: O-antigen ligase family protein [Flavobacteriaceae bacterium]